MESTKHKACLGHGERLRPLGAAGRTFLPGQWLPQGIPRMKEAGWFPEATPSHPRTKLNLFPKWKERALCTGDGVGRGSASSCLHPPPPPPSFTNCKPGGLSPSPAQPPLPCGSWASPALSVKSLLPQL